jgi:hypothetical protein
METVQTSNRRLEALAWAAVLIWWGLTELFQPLPPGIGAVGIGVILLGLNAARSRTGIPASGFTTTLGILALVLGGLDLTAAILHLSFELPVFAILLIVLGAIMLVRELLRNMRE